jgi:hypothetical protein
LHGSDVIESRTKDRILALARSSFKKVPDAPLGVVVARKVKRRAEYATGRKSRQLLISGPQARNPVNDCKRDFSSAMVFP